MTLDLTGPSPSSPDVLALREAQASRAVLRPGARSAPPVRPSYEKDGGKMTRVVLLSRRVSIAAPPNRPVALG